MWSRTIFAVELRFEEMEIPSVTIIEWISVMVMNFTACTSEIMLKGRGQVVSITRSQLPGQFMGTIHQHT